MKRSIVILLTWLQVMALSKAMSQNVSINTTGFTADASSMLDISATDKGLLIPRMTQSQRTAIATPADALLVYQTDGTKGFYFYNTSTSSWTLLASSGGSIVSLNGLTANAQTFATPTTTGTAMSWSSAGSSHTLNIPMAASAAVTAGLLSNTDWTTFNNKLSTVDTGNIANFYLKVRSLHAAGPGIGYNTVTGVISNTGVTSVNGLTGAVNFSTGNITEATSSVLTIAGGTAAVFGSGVSIQVKQASGTQSGFLSSTDWNTFNNKASATSAWSTIGNAGTNSGTNFLGTTDNTSLRFKTNNISGLLLDSLGNLAVGSSPSFTASPNREKLLVDAGSSASPTTSFNVISGKGYIDNYLQLNIQNKAATASASSDVVASNDAATETSNFVDMGINSSGNTSLGVIGGAGTAYLYSTGNDFAIGNGTVGKNLTFFTGGTVGTERMRIDGNGNLGIGITTPATTLHVFGTNPLTLTGVAAGSNTTADSLLTITNGLVRKLPVATFASSSNAISSLNGLTATIQSFLAATGGSDFNISSSGSVHTFNLPDASASARGLITTGAQTLAGSKTFSSAPLFSSLTAGSVPFIGTGGLLSENNTKLFWDATNARLGVGTNTPGSDLTLVQNSGVSTSRGFRFTGNSIAGTNSGTGFTIALGFNQTGNKQLWMGDADNLGLSTASFIRYGSNSTNFPTLDAVAGDNSVRRYLAIGVAGDANSGVIFGGDVNSTNPGSQVWANGNMAIGNGYRARSAPSNGLLVQGNVGLGTFAPATQLHVWSAANPLTLTGVQVGSTTDSLLTIMSGTVRKLPASGFATAGSDWSTSGNTGTSWTNNFMGTTDNVSLRFRTNNVQGMMLDSVGNVAVGNSPQQTSGVNMEKLLVDAGSTAANPTSTINVISGRGYINNYLQLNIQNKSNANLASSDVVATNDAGTEANGINFIDMGVNSSGYTSSNSNILNGANNTYLYGTGSDMIIGNATASKNLIFFTGGTSASNEAMRIDGNGKVGIGTTAPEDDLHTVTTTGSSATPTDVATIETVNTTTTASSVPPQLNLVRQFPSASFVANTSHVGPVLNFGFRTSGTTKNAIAQIQTQSYNSNTRLSFFTRTGMTNGNVTGGTLAEAMTLNGSNLGIGTTSPGSALDVSGDISADNSIYVDAAGTNTGTKTPGLFFGGSSSGEVIASKRTAGTNQYGLDFYTGSNLRMSIITGGNIGIGTNTPTAALHLKAGTATANTAPLKLTSGTNLTTPEPGAVEFDGTNYFATSGTTRYTLAKTLTGTATLDFPSTPASNSSILTISVPGAVDGDPVSVGAPSGSVIGNSAYSAFVSSANTVTVRLVNNSTSAIDPASGTFRVAVIRY